MNPNTWGADTWKYLHIISTNKNTSYTTLRKLFYHLQFLLPCSKCRNNYKRHYDSLKFPKDRKSIPIWLIKIHNNVNREINKPIQDEDIALSFWLNELNSLVSSKDIGLWTFIQCSVHIHPGKRKMTDELLNAHQFIWENIKELIPKDLIDYKGIIEYLDNNPISDISSKYKYHNQVHKLFNKFDLIIDIEKEKQLCNT
jgi:hypothetical protein